MTILSVRFSTFLRAQLNRVASDRVLIAVKQSVILDDAEYFLAFRANTEPVNLRKYIARFDPPVAML